MSKSINNSINWLQASIGYTRPDIGINNEPALTSASMTQQTMQSSPFSYSWNRGYATFQTIANVQDYAVTGFTQAGTGVFGYMEKATMQAAANITAVAAAGGTWTYTAANSFVLGALVTITGLSGEGSPPISFNVTNAVITAVTPTSFSIAGSGTQTTIADTGVACSGKIQEFTKVLNHVPLAPSTDAQQPTTIAAQLNTLTGTVTFRMLGVPKQVYNIVVIYQFAPKEINSLADFWDFPYYMQSIYNLGFKAHVYDAMGDPRAKDAKVAFAAAMLSYSEGLSESEINMFLVQYLGAAAQGMVKQLTTQQGIQGRGNG